MSTNKTYLQQTPKEEKLLEAVLMLTEIVRQVVIEQATRECSGTDWATVPLQVIKEINDELQSLSPQTHR